MSLKVERSPVIRDRRDFAALANLHGCMQAVEVGTDRGDFAEHFMRTWRGYTLRCVDDYTPYPTMPWDRTADMHMAISRLAHYGDRVRFIRATSLDALRFIDPLTPLDFIYIDAQHNYEAVKADVNAWWPRLRPGGILAGHDWNLKDSGEFGVRRAVTELAAPLTLPIYLTYEHHTISTESWYIIKP